MDVGSWSGLTSEEIGMRFPEMTDHDGEEREAFDARAWACFAASPVRMKAARCWWSRTAASSAR